MPDGAAFRASGVRSSCPVLGQPGVERAELAGSPVAGKGRGRAGSRPLQM